MNTKWLKLLFLGFLALVFVLLDTSFFSYLVLYQAQIIISFVVLIIFALKADDQLFSLAFFVVIFFAIFSSLPVWLVVVNFLVIPAIIYYLRKNFLPEPSFFSVPVYFVFATLLFQIILILYSRQFSQKSWVALSYFALLNTVMGVIIYFGTRSILKLFRAGEIKL